MSPSRLTLNSLHFPPPSTSFAFPYLELEVTSYILIPSRLGLLSSLSLLIHFSGPWKSSSLPLPPSPSYPSLLNRSCKAVSSWENEAPAFLSVVFGPAVISWDPSVLPSSFSSWVLLLSCWNWDTASLSSPSQGFLVLPFLLSLWHSRLALWSCLSPKRKLRPKALLPRTQLSHQSPLSHHWFLVQHPCPVFGSPQSMHWKQFPKQNWNNDNFFSDLGFAIMKCPPMQ